MRPLVLGSQSKNLNKWHQFGFISNKADLRDLLRVAL